MLASTCTTRSDPYAPPSRYESPLAHLVCFVDLNPKEAKEEKIRKEGGKKRSGERGYATKLTNLERKGRKVREREGTLIYHLSESRGAPLPTTPSVAFGVPIGRRYGYA